MKETFAMFGDEIIELAPSTKLNHLLLVNQRDPYLDEKCCNRFHSTSARLLYITKIARPYIDPNVAFLCTGVEKSDVYNSIQQA